MGVSEQVIGMGAEADGLAAGAGLAMTTVGGGTAGVGWMGCTYEKRANNPLLPTCPAQESLHGPETGAKMGMKSILLPGPHQKSRLETTYYHPPNDNNL